MEASPIALIGTINIAMQASTAGLQKGFTAARGAMSSLVSFAQGAMHSAMAGVFQSSIRKAEELHENIEKLALVFPETTDVITAQAKKMSAAFGTSQVSFTSAAQKLGGIFKGAGVDENAAAGMTSQLEVLGQAIANFKHISFEEAMGKVQAGLMGRGKGLKEFGIVVSAQMPIQERFNAMMREGAGVIDQMGERANDRKNAFTEFWGRLETIEIMFAEGLPKPVESFFSQLNVGLVALQTAWGNWSNDTITAQNDLTDFGQSSTQSIGMVQKGVGYLADAWQLVTAGFKLVQIGFNASLMAMVKGIAWIGKQIDWLFEKLGMETNTGAGDFLEAFGDNLHDTLQDEVASLKADWAKPWSHEGINASFDAARKKLHDMRTDVANTAKASAAGTDKWSKAGKSTAHPFAEAMTLGSREAASTILRTRAGVGSDKDMAKIAANSEKQTAALERIADGIDDLADNGLDVESLTSL